MNRLNGERLKYISNSMQDVIRDLDEIISLYDSQPIAIS